MNSARQSQSSRTLADEGDAHLDGSMIGKDKFESFLDQVRELLVSGSEIQLDIPFGGRIHIDRRLPFLCVYRQPSGRIDAGTESLVLGEASYLIGSGEKRFQKPLSQLIRLIAEDLSEEFGAFLIVELFSWDYVQNEFEEGPPRPEFSILVAKKRSPSHTIEALEDALESIKILKRRAVVEVVFTERGHAPGLPHLISLIAARRFNCFTVAIGVNPVYRDPNNGHVFPLVLRKLHRGVSHALKKSFFQFSRTQTTHRIVTYQSLGRRAVVKAVWDADRRLAAIAKSFDFILQATPTNIESAWNEFRRARYKKSPVFYYRPRTVDPAILKRRLFQIPIERVEDPTLGALFERNNWNLSAN